MEGLRIRETRRECDERKAKVSRESFVLDLVQNCSLEQLKASNLDHETLLRINEIRKGV